MSHPDPTIGTKPARSTGAIVAALVLFFPLGLYWMWRGHAWSPKARWIVTGITAVIVIAAAGSNNNPPATNTASDTTPTTTTTTSDTATETPAPVAVETTAAPAAETQAPVPPPPAAPAKPSYAGELPGDKLAPTASSPMSLNEWDVQLTALTRRATEFSGNLLCSKVTLHNHDSAKQDYSPLSWKLQTPAGLVEDTTYSGDGDLGSQALAPGGTVKGDVCFDDKAAGAGTFVLAWQPHLFTSEDRVVWLNHL